MRPRSVTSQDPSVMVELRGGYRIQLERLVRYRTYDRFQEVAQTQGMADLITKAALGLARDSLNYRGPAGGPLLAPPELLKTPSMRDSRYVGFLPPWVSYGLFTSNELTWDEETPSRSRLLVVWFQDHADPVLDDRFRAWFRTLRWCVHARSEAVDW